MSLYEEWLEASAELKRAKKRELELRNAICPDVLGDKIEGAVTYYKDGFKVNAVAKLTRTLDREQLEALWDDLTEEEQECIDYKPSLVLSKYKKIEEKGGLLMEAVTVKPAQSTLKIEIE